MTARVDVPQQRLAHTVACNLIQIYQCVVRIDNAHILVLVDELNFISVVLVICEVLVNDLGAVETADCGFEGPNPAKAATVATAQG